KFTKKSAIVKFKSVETQTDEYDFDNFNENYYNNWGDEGDSTPFQNEIEDNDRPTWSINNEETPQIEESLTLTIEQESQSEITSDTIISDKENKYKVRLADGDYYIFMNPFDIKYSQANISNKFSYSGKNLKETIDELLNFNIESIKNIRAIEVCIINDTYYSSDNRRLYCFRKAIKNGANFQKIPVLVRRASDTNIK
ncbi:5811_t:CDS:2, partial [Cetraspora pellucida]